MKLRNLNFLLQLKYYDKSVAEKSLKAQTATLFHLFGSSRNVGVCNRRDRRPRLSDRISLYLKNNPEACPYKIT